MRLPFRDCNDVAGRVGARDCYRPAGRLPGARHGPACLLGEFHEFFGGWGHVFEALPERHHRETGILKVLAHLDRAPPVESELSDIKPGAKILNELLYIPVVCNVALGRFKESLTVPQIVGHVIPGNSEFEAVFGYPKPGGGRQPRICHRPRRVGIQERK